MPVKKVSYVDLHVPSRAGHGAEILDALRREGVNLLAFSGFPEGGGRAQVDVVTSDLPAVRRVAKEEGWRLRRPKKAFVIQGRDRVGAVHRYMKRLAERGINVTATQAVAAGKGQFGMILWVKPKDYARAARALGAR